MVPVPVDESKSFQGARSADTTTPPLDRKSGQSPTTQPSSLPALLAVPLMGQPTLFLRHPVTGSGSLPALVSLDGASCLIRPLVLAVIPAGYKYSYQEHYREYSQNYYLEHCLEHTTSIATSIARSTSRSRYQDHRQTQQRDLGEPVNVMARSEGLPDTTASSGRLAEVGRTARSDSEARKDCQIQRRGWKDPQRQQRGRAGC